MKMYEEFEEFEHIWADDTPQGAAGGATDVTSYPASATPKPPAPELPLEDILDDPDYDQISDREEVVEDEACWRGDPIAIRRRAMADDFSEGKLETVVDSPQKELAGTQNQYVSYQVTTKVTTPIHNHIPLQYLHRIVRLPVLPKVRVLRPSPLHRLRLPLQTALERVPTMRGPAAARQAQDGVCAG